ncbi:MAG: hypothetical protein ABW046_02820, partial [Actinoplanes sp.]
MTSRVVTALRAAYPIVLVVCGSIAVGRIMLGGLAFVAAHQAGLLPRHDRLLVVTGAPVVRTVIEFGFSFLTIGLSVVLLVAGRRDRSLRLLGLAVLATGGTGNLWTG